MSRIGSIRRPGIPSMADPFTTAQQNETWGAIGQTAEAAKGARAGLSASGLSATPGITSALQNRSQAQLGRNIGGIQSKYAMARINYNEDKRRYDEEQAWKQKMYNDSKSAAEKEFWSNLLGAGINLAGAALL